MFVWESLHLEACVCDSVHRYHDEVLSVVMLLFEVPGPGQTRWKEHGARAAVNTHSVARLYIPPHTPLITSTITTTITWPTIQIECSNASRCKTSQIHRAKHADEGAHMRWWKWPSEEPFSVQPQVPTPLWGTINQSITKIPDFKLGHTHITQTSSSLQHGPNRTKMVSFPLLCGPTPPSQSSIL